MRYHLCVSAPHGEDLTDCKAVPRFTGRTRHSLLALFTDFRYAAPNRIHVFVSLPYSDRKLSAQTEKRYFCPSLRYLCGLYFIFIPLSSLNCF